MRRPAAQESDRADAPILGPCVVKEAWLREDGSGGGPSGDRGSRDPWHPAPDPESDRARRHHWWRRRFRRRVPAPARPGGQPAALLRGDDRAVRRHLDPRHLRHQVRWLRRHRPIEVVAGTALGLLAIGAIAFALSVHFGLIGGPQFVEGLVVSERPLSLNPLVGASDPAVVDVGHLLYRPLLKLNQVGYPVPDLAQSYAVSPSGLIYTVTMPPNLDWSDGSPITTADVAATAAFALSSEASDPTLATQFRGVKVAATVSTVTFTLPMPRASFAATLTELPILPLGQMSSSGLVAAARDATVPMPTSGPYDVQSTGPLAIVLRPNPHAVARPAIKTYELRLFLTFADAAYAFANGNVGSLLATTPEELTTLLGVKGAQAETITTPEFVDLMFNEHVPALTNSVVRHAIGIAINRSSLVNGALNGRGGLVETGPFSLGLPWVGPPGIEANSPAVAELVLQANGWVTGPDGVRHRGSTRLAFTLSVPDINPLPVAAREVATQLRVIGVAVAVQLIAPERFLSDSVDSGRFQLAIDAWSPVPDPDVSAFWRSNAAPPHGYNVSGGVADPFLDAALDTLAESTGRAARATAAAQVAALVADDAPAVFLYTPRVSVVFRSPMPTAPMPAIGEEWARYASIAAWQLH